MPEPDQVTNEDREIITILLERKAAYLSEGETDFLHGIRFCETVTAEQRETLETLWMEVMDGDRAPQTV